MKELLEAIDLLATDHVYRPVLISERKPEEPGFYFCFTSEEERIIMSRSDIIRAGDNIKYWLEVVPKSII